MTQIHVNAVKELWGAMTRQRSPNMKIQMKKILITLTVLAALASNHLALAAPLGTGFTYQGRLNDGGAPANGVYDLAFTLYGDATDSLYFGEHIVLSNV